MTSAVLAGTVVVGPASAAKSEILFCNELLSNGIVLIWPQKRDSRRRLAFVLANAPSHPFMPWAAGGLANTAASAQDSTRACGPGSHFIHLGRQGEERGQARAVGGGFWRKLRRVLAEGRAQARRLCGRETGTGASTLTRKRSVGSRSSAKSEVRAALVHSLCCCESWPKVTKPPDCCSKGGVLLWSSPAGCAVFAAVYGLDHPRCATEPWRWWRAAAGRGSPEEGQLEAKHASNRVGPAPAWHRTLGIEFEFCR